MAENPFIAARLRNPAEEAAAKPKAAKPDWVGGVCAILAFLVAVATTTFLYLEWDQLRLFINPDQWF